MCSGGARGARAGGGGSLASGDIVDVMVGSGGHIYVLAYEGEASPYVRMLVPGALLGKHANYCFAP